MTGNLIYFGIIQITANMWIKEKISTNTKLSKYLYPCIFCIGDFRVLAGVIGVDLKNMHLHGKAGKRF